MSNEKKSTMINILGLLVMAATILTMSLGLIKGFLTSAQSNIIVGIGLFIFWLLSDIVEPVVCKRFDDTTLARKEAYVKYIALDLAGYAGVLYFLMGVGRNGQSGSILGAVIYIVSMRPKRHQRDIFYGLVTEEETEEEAEETNAAEAVEAEVVEETTEEEV